MGLRVDVRLVPLRIAHLGCKPYYPPRIGAPSLPLDRYFRMHMIGYFEGIDSERGIAWRCADSFSLRDFLRQSNREKFPDGIVTSTPFTCQTRQASVGSDGQNP